MRSVSWVLGALALDPRETHLHSVSVAHSEGETPGPIPNPEVKPFSADGTAWETAWESRTPPDMFPLRAVTVEVMALSAFWRWQFVALTRSRLICGPRAVAAAWHGGCRRSVHVGWCGRCVKRRGLKCDGWRA